MSDLFPLRLRRQPTPALATAPASGPVADAAPARLAYVETYGCQMNVADTEMVLGLLHGAGYGRTDDPACADLILLNTCAVREKAEERVYARASMLAAHKARPGVVLGITGCMAEHLKGAVQEQAPYVDLVVGPDGYRRLLEHVESARGGRPVEDTRLDRFETYEGLDPARAMSTSGGVTGHITIQRGCDKFCTFCVVPYTRGRERGTPPREVLRQARAMAAAGYKEVQLLGQTVNSYRHQEVSFADLLRAVATVDGLERIRFTSPYPLDFSPAVIAAMADTPRVCKHVHLPLQTASDTVLARMRRGYDYADFRRLVAALRAAMPAIAITTDILVGFCDETEEEFQAILRAQQELRFDGAFMFAYSERAGTFAARRMPDTVPEAIKQRRLAEVIALQKQISTEIMAAQVGKRERVLVEHPSKRSAGEMLARTDGFRAVVIPAGPGAQPGALLDVVIERATSATLFGTPWAA
ncbi:MAG TPA: tRNA (N6-isopentenyl adenosine(37)-C2)-methylthiotransferase MiaB [Polyangia bacterium]|jgi:tRNA-2-methylthio-N6-dimethylallyladenosine synthase|nr:tRNA (N6-isopentenyl adenosine(37)-C2)-methylthiotransferase MiaB [Polyangia bacterium]